MISVAQVRLYMPLLGFVIPPRANPTATSTTTFSWCTIIRTFPTPTTGTSDQD
jgi:hypothetical protein